MPERTISTLKSVKTFSWNATGENQLNGLILLSAYRSIKVDT